MKMITSRIKYFWFCICLSPWDVLPQDVLLEYWTEHHNGTPLRHICILNCDILQVCSRLCNWLSVWCLVPWNFLCVTPLLHSHIPEVFYISYAAHKHYAIVKIQKAQYVCFPQSFCFPRECSSNEHSLRWTPKVTFPCNIHTIIQTLHGCPSQQKQINEW